MDTFQGTLMSAFLWYNKDVTIQWFYNLSGLPDLYIKNQHFADFTIFSQSSVQDTLNGSADWPIIVLQGGG